MPDVGQTFFYFDWLNMYLSCHEDFFQYSLDLASSILTVFPRFPNS